MGFWREASRVERHHLYGPFIRSKIFLVIAGIAFRVLHHRSVDGGPRSREGRPLLAPATHARQARGKAGTARLTTR
ncbi:hypothetical protein BURKHO8Y_240347 [Burkholderia sp. 8Y]|nr:hypothetical protein BURKHO8Y_240347 [Burkholderia sp. 8Y]